jgi:hypothetical protein
LFEGVDARAIIIQCEQYGGTVHLFIRTGHNPGKKIFMTSICIHKRNIDHQGLTGLFLFGSTSCLTFIGVSTRGVPGPTSKLSLRVPSQMGRRETEHEGGEKETGKRGNPRPSCCPAPRSGALAVGGYKRPRERERETLRVVPFPRATNLLVREPWTFLL